MFRIVLPLIASTRGQSGRTISTASTTNSTDPTSAANSAGTTNSTRAPNSTSAPNSTDATDPTNPTSAANSADATSTTNPTNAARSTNSADVPAIAATRDRVCGAVAPIDVRVAIEIVVHVDVDVVMPPSATPAPTAAPERPHHDADAKRNRNSRGVVAGRRVVDRRVGIYRGTVYHHGVVRRYIHDLRIRLFDHDHTFAFDDLRLYFLLLVRFQVAVALGLLAHALDGVHHIALLREEGIAQVGGPLNVVGQSLDQVGETRQRLDAGIPWLLGNGIGECLVFQVLIFFKPLLELDDFQRIGRSSQNLGEHRVRIKSDRRYQRIELIGRYFRGLVLS